MDQMRLLNRRGGLELAADGEGRNGLEDREGRATLALRRDVVDSNLVVRELEALLVIDRDCVELSQARVAMVDHGFKP